VTLALCSCTARRSRRWDMTTFAAYESAESATRVGPH
jgi:hypothetical protein